MSKRTLQPARKKSQREPHLYSADHAVILGLANTLPATAEHYRLSSRDAGTIKRQRGANAHQRGTPIDPGEDKKKPTIMC